MADRKITDLTALAAGSQATGDLLTIVDVSEAAATDKNKKITVESLFKGIPGDVGIGTSSPSTNLEVSRTGNNPQGLSLTATDVTLSPRLFFESTSTNNAPCLFGNDGDLVIHSGATPGSSSGTERMRIDSSGNVGIGTTSASSDIHLKRTSADAILRIENTGNGNASGIFFVRENSSGTSKGAANIHVVSDTSGTGTELIFGCGSNTSATGGERFRLTSTGKLLINHSASRSVGAQRIVQIEGTSDATAGISILRNTNDSSSPTINLGKSRGTSTGSNTIVQNGDGLGSIYFRAADGTDINSIAASIDVGVDGTPGSNDTPGRIMFGTTADGASSPTERVRIDSSGRLLLNSGSDVRIELGTNGTTATNDRNHLRGDGDNMKYNCCADGIHVFEQNGTERMRIDSSGRLLVGTSSSSASAAAVFQGNSFSSGQPNQVYFQRDTAGTSLSSGDGIGFLLFADNAGNVFSQIACQADAGTGSSDYPGRLTFSTTNDNASSPTERMRINSDGVTNIHRTTGALQLRIGTLNGSSFEDRENTMLIYGHSSNDFVQLRACNTADGTPTFEVKVNNVRSIEIEADGDIYNVNGTYGTISDARLKENIVDASSQWGDVKDLQVRNFNFTEASGLPTNTQIGFVAQEVEQVSPGLVKTNPDLDQDGNDLGTTTKAVKTSVLLVKAIKALQEAMDRIETLEASNADLLARVTALEAG